MIIDNQLLDQVSGQAKESERLRMNFNLHETLDAKAQRLLNALEVGTVLPIHRHRHTAETYILLRGHINVMFYNADGGEMERYELYPGNLWGSYSERAVAYFGSSGTFRYI